MVSRSGRVMMFNDNSSTSGGSDEEVGVPTEKNAIVKYEPARKSVIE